MKFTTVLVAILSVVFFNSCSSSPSTSTVDNVQKITEGGSSQDTLNIASDNADRAYVFETFNKEGGSSHDTIYLKPRTRAKFYKVRDFKIRKKP